MAALGKAVRRRPASADFTRLLRRAVASRSKRISEKCPSGGIDRRSITRTPPLRSAHCSSRAQANSGCQPSLRAIGANDRSKSRRRPALGAEMVDQDDLAARPRDARELVQRAFRIGHRGDDVLREHRVERAVREAEPRAVHHRERLDVLELALLHALLRLAQHRLRIVDADHAVACRNSRSAKCRCRCRRRGCARRPVRRRRSSPCGPARARGRRRGRRSEQSAPTAHRSSPPSRC